MLPMENMDNNQILRARRPAMVPHEVAGRWPNSGAEFGWDSESLEGSHKLRQKQISKVEHNVGSEL